MRTVIIGATGHVGGYLVPRLVAAGHEVVAISRGQSAPYRDDPAESCLYSVFVLPEKQNRGVGRALIGAIERDPWFLTARRVIIPASINALHFYQGLGYTFAPGGDTLDEEQLYCLEKFPQPRT